MEKEITPALTIGEALHQATESLGCAGIDEGPLEAELLLCHVLGLSRVGLHLSVGQHISPGGAKGLAEVLRRRLGKEPVAYIIGHKEFCGLDFVVTRHTLIPRPETELLVERALKLAAGHLGDSVIVDVGTGCGAIAVALAASLPRAQVCAIDISAAALEIASVNCRRHRVAHRVHLLRGDLLEPLEKSADLIVANLPYVSDQDLADLPEEIRRFEPLIALAGGGDGLEQIRRLLAQSRRKLRRAGAVLVEISPGQRTAVADMAESYFPGAMLEIVVDLSGHDRLVVVRGR